jgi:hypothetical protein
MWRKALCRAGVSKGLMEQTENTENSVVTDRKCTHRGVRQRSALSPVLFNMVRNNKSNGRAREWTDKK